MIYVHKGAYYANEHNWMNIKGFSACTLKVLGIWTLSLFEILSWWLSSEKDCMQNPSWFITMDTEHVKHVNCGYFVKTLFFMSCGEYGKIISFINLKEYIESWWWYAFLSRNVVIIIIFAVIFLWSMVLLWT